MKSLKNTLKTLIAIASLVSGVSIVAMQEQAPREASIQATVILPAEKSAWLERALAAKVSNPLKVRVLNHSNANAKTFQQGRDNRWFANIPVYYGSEDLYFSMDKPSQDGLPQYIMRTDKNIYVMNFIKEDSGFKAELQKLELAPDASTNLPDNQILNLAGSAKKTPFQEFKNIEPGNTLTVVLDPNMAQLTTNERAVANLDKETWIKTAREGRVELPLKMRVINHGDTQVTTVQQGRDGMWPANVPVNYVFEDIYFDLKNLENRKPEKEEFKNVPGYTILTKKDVYTLNFQENGPLFNAVLEKAAIAKTNNISELLKRIKSAYKTPVQTLDGITTGDVVTVTVDESNKASIAHNE